MIQLENGKNKLYQWDLNQRLIVDVEAGVQVHFASDRDDEDKALPVVAYSEDELVYANIPNIMLQTPGIINVYIYPTDGVTGYTKQHFKLRVVEREKPTDYVYTETETLNYETLRAELLEKIEESSGTGGLNIPITYIENLDKTNRRSLRDLESGMYILQGYFTAYTGSTASFTFSTGMLVSVVHTSTITYVQIFYAKYNTLQYLEITDDGYTRNDAKLVNMESTANKVTEITEDSTDEQYPSAKAVYDALNNSGGNSTSVRVADVTLNASSWVGDKSPYSQVVNITGTTERSQVDLTPSVEQLAIFYDKDLGFVTENVDGVVTVYAIGQKPQNDYVIQVTITEVNI